jgi:Ni,Fe-hydrogenase III small subunit
MKVLNQAVKNLFSTKRPAESVEVLMENRPKMPFASLECIKCGKCSEVCETRAITVENRWRIDIGKCISCGNCANTCEQKAIEWIDAPDYTLSRNGLIFISGEPTERTPELLDGTIRKKLGRSLNIREIDTGSCNACEVEVNALSNQFYDMNRFGIKVVASPRHADILLITGPLTENMHDALMKAVKATPDPNVLVAMGTCAISGGMFTDGKTVGHGINDTVTVNIFIPGCPPSPDRLIRSLLSAFGSTDHYHSALRTPDDVFRNTSGNNTV